MNGEALRLNGASDALDVRRDDLEGTLRWHSARPTLILYDDVPGGAGHVQRLREHLPAVLDAALARVERACCGPETSCYECLRTYRNQFAHDVLSRGVAREALRLLVHPPHAGDGASHTTEL